MAEKDLVALLEVIYPREEAALVLERVCPHCSRRHISVNDKGIGKRSQPQRLWQIELQWQCCLLRNGDSKTHIRAQSQHL